MNSLAAAHDHCSHNRLEIERSKTVGCFYCCQIYDASLIKDWIDDGKTALCAKCPVDAVLGDASGFPVIDEAFLKAMNKAWF